VVKSKAAQLLDPIVSLVATDQDIDVPMRSGDGTVQERILGEPAKDKGGRLELGNGLEQSHIVHVVCSPDSHWGYCPVAFRGHAEPLYRHRHSSVSGGHR